MASSTIPAVGAVRCYWALLQPHYPAANPANPTNSTTPGSPNKLELKIVYLDPVLSSHLHNQRSLLLQRGVIEFIHPTEREQARNDLANAIQSDDLQGSVTRMRFARLSRIRSLLGAAPQDNPQPTRLNGIAEDDDYLILDLVLNWVADGLLLAFFHAIKDLDPEANNDPVRKYDGWSNYCGTDNMQEEQIQALQQAISGMVAPPPRTRFPPTRVFQLHTTSSLPTHPTQLLFSWPPPRRPGSGATNDGLYDADEYADLMRGVDMDPNLLTAKPGEVRTNCTTRFGAEHSIRTEGVYRHVTSVFIPYGSIVFACFQTTKLYELPASAGAAGAEPWSPSAGVGMPANTLHAATSGQEWHDSATTPYPPPANASQPYPAGDPYPAAAGVTPPYGTHPATYTAHALHPAHEPPALHPGSAPTGRIRTGDSSGPTPPRSIGGAGGSRPLVRPPGDVDKCRGCGTRESPEWRKGENGVKDLCNACGLKLARAVAKREGRQKPRKKDK